jgi:hypothetical protein
MPTNKQSPRKKKPTKSLMISGVFISGNVDFFMLVGKTATFPSGMCWKAS